MNETELRGEELKVGDIISVWWSPGWETIAHLAPYQGPYENGLLKGARIATFAARPNLPMTIEAQSWHTVRRP